MSNSIFDWPASLKRFVRFTSAKAEDVNDALDDLSAGMDTVEANLARAVKLPTGTADQTLALAAGQRAGLLLGFGQDGNITAIAGGGRWLGDWTTGSSYVVSDYFKDPATKNIYVSLSIHTATTISADLAAGRIRLVIDVGDVEAQRVLAQQAAASSSGSASEAAQSASASAQSATDATNNGAAQVALASGHASNAAQSAAGAETSRLATVDIQTATKAALDSFETQYLGSSVTNPSVGKDGGPLIVGALYWNSSVGEMRVWDGASWNAAYLPSSSYATKDYADNNPALYSPTWHFSLNL